MVSKNLSNYEIKLNRNCSSPGEEFYSKREEFYQEDLNSNHFCYDFVNGPDVFQEPLLPVFCFLEKKWTLFGYNSGAMGIGNRIAADLTVDWMADKLNRSDLVNFGEKLAENCCESIYLDIGLPSDGLYLKIDQESGLCPNLAFSDRPGLHI